MTEREYLNEEKAVRLLNQWTKQQLSQKLLMYASRAQIANWARQYDIQQTNKGVAR